MSDNKIQYSKKFDDGSIIVVGGDTVEEFVDNYTMFKQTDVAKQLFAEIAAAPKAPAPTNGHQDITPEDESWCPIHQVQMKQYEKEGRYWYSHKVGDTWCKGK